MVIALMTKVASRAGGLARPVDHSSPGCRGGLHRAELFDGEAQTAQAKQCHKAARCENRAVRDTIDRHEGQSKNGSPKRILPNRRFLQSFPRTFIVSLRVDRANSHMG